LFAPLFYMLSAQLEQGRPAHAYIFQGEGGYDQAISFAAHLCCGEENAPCGKCTVCRNIAAGSYPYCRVIEPDKGAHRIDAMRGISMQAQLAAEEGGWKVFILRDADKLTDEAANNVLKLLEEPPEHTVFILLSEQPDKLLPTILSRCQLFMLGGHGIAEQDTDAELLKEAEQFLLSLPQISIYEVLLLAKEKENREDQREFLFALLKVLHEATVGKRELPMSYEPLLRSETMVESAVELMDKEINRKLLTDVVYLRLWQNSRS